MGFRSADWSSADLLDRQRRRKEASGSLECSEQKDATWSGFLWDAQQDGRRRLPVLRLVSPQFTRLAHPVHALLPQIY